MTLKIPTKEEIIKDMITNPQNYAAIYARQSNLKTSNSLSSQILKGQELALKNNLLIYKTYAEKISATESYFTERKEFNQLILDAKAGFFKTVIVFKRDRLARRIEDFLEIKKIFKTLGIKILYSNEEEFQGNDTHISDFIENIIMAVSEFEPKNIKSRTEEGRKKKREKGEYYGKPPFGYEAIKGNSTINSNSNDERIVSKYKINNNEAHIVKTIFQIFVENEEIKTTKDISNKLLELNITLPQNLNESKIRSIINRPVYAALQTISLDYKYNNFRLIDKDNNLIPIELKYFHNCTNVDKIINKETWLKAVYKWIKLHPNERRVKKKRRKKKYLFKDILYCSNCGNKITLSGESYSCKTKGCTRVKKDILIKTLLTKLLYNLLNEENIDTAITSNNNILKKELKKYCNTLTININNQGNLVKRYIDNPENENIKASIKNLVKEEKKLKENINDIKNQIKYLNFYFKPIIIPLANTSYINIVIKDLINEEDIIQNLFIQNIEKVIIDGDTKKVTIREIQNKK